MRLTAVCLALALSLAASAASAARPVHDDGLMATFKTVCLDTRGDAPSVMELVEADGWKPSPAAQATGVRAYVKTVGPRRWELILKDASNPADRAIPFPTRRNTCAITLTPDTVDARAALRGYMGVDPSETNGAASGWIYTEEGATRDDIKDPPPNFAREAVDRGPLVIIQVTPRGDGNVMVFTRIAKIEP